jgi:hypothetical protein
LHSTKWSDREKKGWKPLSSKNTSIQDSVRNEENGNPVPEPNSTMINTIKKPVTPTKNSQRGNLGKNL